MNKFLLYLSFLVIGLVSCTVLSSCGDDDDPVMPPPTSQLGTVDKAYAGRWLFNGGEMTLNEDGTGHFTLYAFMMGGGASGGNQGIPASRTPAAGLSFDFKWGISGKVLTLDATKMGMTRKYRIASMDDGYLSLIEWEGDEWSDDLEVFCRPDLLANEVNIDLLYGKTWTCTINDEVHRLTFDKASSVFTLVSTDADGTDTERVRYTWDADSHYIYGYELDDAEPASFIILYLSSDRLVIFDGSNFGPVNFLSA